MELWIFIFLKTDNGRGMYAVDTEQDRSSHVTGTGLKLDCRAILITLEI